MGTEECETVTDLIDTIIGACNSVPYLYRGTNKAYYSEDQVSSQIYRNHKELFKRFGKSFLPVEIEEVIVSRAKPHFNPNARNIDILTDLRHFKGETTLIDFSHNLMIALFFACNGKINSTGQIIALRTTGLPTLKEIDYTKKGTLGTSIIYPASTSRSINRSRFQNSVFVHAPSGYILEEHWTSFDVSSKLKHDCLEYLKKFLQIDANAIYNDLYGFIANEDNYSTALDKMYSGLAYTLDKKYLKAIEYFDEAIRLNPDLDFAYYSRGNAYFANDLNKKCLDDYDEAIRRNPNYAEYYFTRGYATIVFNDLKKGINDYDEAIRRRPNFAEYYYYRGMANLSLLQWNKAINDLDEAIRLMPSEDNYYVGRGLVKEIFNYKNDALLDYYEATRINQNNGNAYYRRGLLKKELGDKEGSKADLEQACELGSDLYLAGQKK